MARRNGTGTIKPCLECGRPIRPKHWPAAKHPGTLAHAGNGKCSGCNTKQIRETQPAAVPSVPERPDTDYNRRALLDYFASRRKFRIALGQTEFPNPLNIQPELEPEPEPTPMQLRQNPCGTDAAYRRHIRNKETIDSACREAHRIACWEYQQRKRKEKNT